MNWYKLAQLEFPTWLSQKLLEETNEYKDIKSKIYPSMEFTPKNIHLVQYWVEQTNPNLQNFTLKEAINKANEWYGNISDPANLKEKDINKNALLYGLTSSSLNDRLNIDTQTLKIKNIKKSNSDIIPDVFNYTVTVIFDAFNSKTNRKETWEARLVTKDGQYFSFAQAIRLLPRRY